MMEPIRTLHILTSLNRRGAETFAIQLVDRLSRPLFLPSLWTLVPAEVNSRYLVPQYTEVLSGRGSNGPPGAFRTLRHLIGDMRVWKPHLVQCHGGRALKYAMLAKPFYSQCRYVYTKIGSVHPWLDPVHKRFFYGFLFEHVDAIIAVGEQVRREVEAVFHPRRPRLITINTGRDVAPFEQATPEVIASKRRDLGLDPTDLCLMTVGSLSWEKNPRFLLQILPALLAQVPSVKLVYVGDGPLEASLREQVARQDLSSHVRFAGLRSDVPQLLGAADVFALPSVTEGLPGVLIEAGMAGVPAVAFRAGSVDDVLQDGETGFVVPTGDAGAFTAQTLKLLHDAGLRKRMAAEALTRCRRDFDIRHSVARHEALFLELVALRQGLGAEHALIGQGRP